MKIKLFVSAEGAEQSERIEVESEAAVKSILEAAAKMGLAAPADSSVFDEEGEESLELGHSIAKAGLKDKDRVHLHRCKKIKVTVHYKASTDEKTFPPSATVKKVHKWASKMLPSDVDRGEHVLQICESEKRPAPQVQIGTLTKGGVCTLCFDLVPSERIEG